MNIQIEPLVETRTITFTSLDVRVQAVNLGISADVLVVLYTSDPVQNVPKNLVLEQPEYSQWGDDDQFVIDWALAQIGATPIPEVPPVE